MRILEAYDRARRGDSYAANTELCMNAIKKVSTDCTGKVVLDVACGDRNPFFTECLPAARRVVGIDGDDEAIRRNPLLDVPLVGDLHALPLADASIDLILSVDTIEHSRDPLLFLTECNRVLRGGGQAVFVTPNLLGYKNLIARFCGKRVFDWIWRTFKGKTLAYDTLYRANTAPRVRRLARDSGLQCKDLVYIPSITHFFYPFPILFAAARAWDVLMEGVGLRLLWNYMIFVLEKPATLAPGQLAGVAGPHTRLVIGTQ